MIRKQELKQPLFHEAQEIAPPAAGNFHLRLDEAVGDWESLAQPFAAAFDVHLGRPTDPVNAWANDPACSKALAHRAEYVPAINAVMNEYADWHEETVGPHASAAVRHVLEGGGRPEPLSWDWIQGYAVVGREMEALCRSLCAGIAGVCSGSPRVRSVQSQVIASERDPRLFDLSGTLGGFKSGARRYLSASQPRLPLRQVSIDWRLGVQSAAPTCGDLDNWHFTETLPISLPCITRPGIGGEQAAVGLRSLPEKWAYCLERLEPGKRDFRHHSGQRKASAIDCCADPKELERACQQACQR